MAIKNGLRPVHPGEVLREEFMKPTGLSSNALARALHIPVPRINEVVRERRGISADTAMRLAPVTIEEAHAIMAETRVFQLLKGHRGKPGADTDALAKAIVAVSVFASRGANAISSVEINPLRVLESGHGVMALDALLVTR